MNHKAAGNTAGDMFNGARIAACKSQPRRRRKPRAYVMSSCRRVERKHDAVSRCLVVKDVLHSMVVLRTEGTCTVLQLEGRSTVPCRAQNKRVLHLSESGALIFNLPSTTQPDPPNQDVYIVRVSIH